MHLVDHLHCKLSGHRVLCDVEKVVNGHLPGMIIDARGVRL